MVGTGLSASLSFSGEGASAGAAARSSAHEAAEGQPRACVPTASSALKVALPCLPAALVQLAPVLAQPALTSWLCFADADEYDSHW